MLQHAHISAVKTSLQTLIDAMDAQNADAILLSTADVHQSLSAAASHDAWHISAHDHRAKDDHGLLATLEDAMSRIRAAEFRVKYLTDYAQRRIDILAQRGVAIPSGQQRNTHKGQA